MEALKNSFRPEFLNRLDEIVLFDTLSHKAIEQIIEIQIKEIEARLEDKNITLKLSKAALEELIEKGYDTAYGARPIRRALQTYVLNPLANAMITDKHEHKATFCVDYKQDEFVYELKVKKNGKAKASPVQIPEAVAL